MKVSVVIPCHNAARWVGGALRSVAAQTRPPHEVVVVDDASSDDSARAVRGSGVDVRLLRVDCRNAAAARNAGAEVATGDWIALLDADDEWYPDHLARAADVLLGTADVAYRGLYDELTAEGARRPLGRMQPITETRSGLTHIEYMRLEDQELVFGHSSFLYRADRFREVGGFDPEQVRRHDIDLWLRVIRDRTWAWDTVPSVAYRVDTPGSISRSYAECEYYYLKALVRNKDAYPGPDMDRMLAKIARKVMTIGFADSAPAEFARYRGLAWPYLPPKVRWAYRAAGLAPGVARRAIRLKRAVFTWRTGTRLPELRPAGGRL